MGFPNSWGVYRDMLHLMNENQVDRKMENEMETEAVGIRVGSQNSQQTV